MRLISRDYYDQYNRKEEYDLQDIESDFNITQESEHIEHLKAQLHTTTKKPKSDLDRFATRKPTPKPQPSISPVSEDELPPEPKIVE
jgi:hypothetical protein